MKPKFHTYAILGSGLLVLCLTPRIKAVEIVKTNDANALNLGTSWVGGTAPGSGDVAVFNSTLTSALNPAIGGDISWQGIKVTNPGAGVGIYNTGTGTSGSVLTICLAGIDMSAATQNLTIRARVTLAADQDWNVASNRTLALDGWGTVPSGGPVNLDLGGFTATKKGAGTLNILNGYGLDNGKLVIDAGTVQINNTTSGPRNVGATSGFTFRVNSGSLGINNNVTATSGLVWNAKVEMAGGRFNLGFNNGAGPLSIGGVIEAVASTTSQIDYANTNGSTTALVVEIPAGLTGSGTLTFRATTTTANRLQDRVTLLGDNSGFSGTMDVNSATAGSNRTLRIGASSSGSAAGTWNIATGNTLEVHGVNTSLGTLSGAGTLKNSSSTAATVTVGGTGASSTFSGVIDAGSGVLNLVKTGAGTLTLSGASSYAGKTTVDGGTLSINADNRLGAAPGSNVADHLILNGGTLATSATFTMGGTRGTQLGASGGIIQTADATTLTMWSPISGTGSLTKTGSGTLLLNSYNSFNGGFLISEGAVTTAASANRFNPTNAITIASGASLTINASQAIGSLAGAGSVNLATGTLTVGGPASTTFSGSLSGTGGLTKSGNGTLTLSGASDYSGTTSVTAGTLVVGDGTSGSAASSAFSVSGTGTLKGSGTIGALTVSTGGTVAPGNSPGVLTTGDFDLDGGTYLAELTGTIAGDEYDQIHVNGTLALDGLLDLSLGFTPSEDDIFFLILNDGIDSVSGTFTGLAQDATFSTGGSSFLISYQADSGTSSLTGGNDVAVIVIPEPSAALLGGLGVLVLLRRRK
jgi:autotransporter-associated beta strand protein